MDVRKIKLPLLATLLQFFISSLAQAQYTVLPQRNPVRGHLWIGEGIVEVLSSNKSLGHRLRLGGEVHFGEDYQFILGWTVFDRIWSGENATSVGDVARRSNALNVGYFVVPDSLWLMYSLEIQDVSGNAILDSVTILGHQLSIGHRFYSNGHFNLAIEAAYLFSPSYFVTTYNYATQVAGSAVFPVATIWSLNLRIGFDLGGLES